MQAFLAFLVRSRAQATLSAALGLLLPPFSFVSGGIIGLAVLRHGPAEGALVLVGAVSLAGAVTGVLFHSIAPMVVFAVLTGLPVLALTSVLRLSASQGVTLAAAGLLGAVAIGAIHLLTGDPVQWWRAMLDRFLLGGTDGGFQGLDPAASQQMERVADVLAAMMASLPAGAVVAAMLVVFLARWWHAALDNPGGFAREFRGLRLDPRAAPLALAVTLLALVWRDALGGIWPALFELAVVVYGMQGVAIAHALVAARGASLGWLVTMYLLVLIVPSTAMATLALAGVSDTWMDYRRRWSPGT